MPCRPGTCVRIRRDGISSAAAARQPQKLCENWRSLMTTAPQRSLRMRKMLFAAVLLLAAMALVLAIRENRTWNIPDEAKQLKNPLQPSPSGLQAAHSMYLDNCAQCHGETGKGD